MTTGAIAAAMVGRCSVARRPARAAAAATRASPARRPDAGTRRPTSAAGDAGARRPAVRRARATPTPLRPACRRPTARTAASAPTTTTPTWSPPTTRSIFLTDVTCSGATSDDVHRQAGRRRSAADTDLVTRRHRRQRLRPVHPDPDAAACAARRRRPERRALHRDGRGRARDRRAQDRGQPRPACSTRSPRPRPTPQVLVVGYPRCCPTPGSCPDLVPLADGRLPARGQHQRGPSTALREQAEQRDLTYVDVYGASEGHDVCSDDPWVNGQNIGAGRHDPVPPVRRGAGRGGLDDRGVAVSSPLTLVGWRRAPGESSSPRARPRGARRAPWRPSGCSPRAARRRRAERRQPVGGDATATTSPAASADRRPRRAGLRRDGRLLHRRPALPAQRPRDHQLLPALEPELPDAGGRELGIEVHRRQLLRRHDDEHVLQAEVHRPRAGRPSSTPSATRADLVTLGIGANDFRYFSRMIFTCLASPSATPTGQPCRERNTTPAGPGPHREAPRRDPPQRRPRRRAPSASAPPTPGSCSSATRSCCPASGTCRAKLPLAVGDYAYARDAQPAPRQRRQARAASAPAPSSSTWSRPARATTSAPSSPGSPASAADPSRAHGPAPLPRRAAGRRSADLQLDRPALMGCCRTGASAAPGARPARRRR